MVQNTIKHIFISACILCTCINAFAQGLGFSGMEKTIDQRTSFNVFNSTKYEFKNELIISFKFTIMPNSELGYILRIKDFKNDKVWNISISESQDSVLLRLNQEGHYSVIKTFLPKEQFKKLHWYDIMLAFNLKEKYISMSINGEKQTATITDLPEALYPILEFGKSDHMIDVPTFAIKNLHIKGGKHDFYFNLDEYEGNYAYDTKWQTKGKVINPIWKAKHSVEWEKIKESTSDMISGATYNPQKKEFYYFDRQHIEIYSVMTAKNKYIKFDVPCPVELKLGNNFISTDGNFLYSYELYDECKRLDQASVACLDLNTYKWKVISTDNLLYPHHHHCGFINNTTKEYTIFGGFGDMLYNGTFWSLRKEKWQKSWPENQPSIYPRYFTSCGTDSTDVYIFGGMGNESGEQIVGRQYFYDLYKVNLKTGDCQKMWDLDWKENNLVPVRNMIIKDGYFYTLCYPEYISESHLKLYRFSLKNGEYKTFSDEIPIISNKMRTNANLYYDKDVDMYFAIIQEFEDDIKSTVKIYSLLCPAKGFTELKTIPFRYKHKGIFACICFLPALIIASILLLVFFHKKKKKEDTITQTSSRKLFKAEHRKNSILLFGDFSVIDREGNNITILFTAQQRLILCLLFKYHLNGLSSKRLSNILWPDKDEDKVKNSRGVALNNLRKSLSNLDGISIVFTEGRYHLEITSDFYCDYLVLEDLMANENQDIDHILDILSEGKFLNFMNDDVMDSFKEDVENKIEPILLNELQKRYDFKEYQAVVEISEIISFIDPVNEKSMKLSVWALKRQKRTEEALIRYADFCSEYKNIYDTDYSIRFDSL